jgi:diguanylate cyclase (GGDEF)-like protein/PAS domain S-box-containing protein
MMFAEVYDSERARPVWIGDESLKRDPHAMLDKVCQGARDLIGAGYAVLGVKTKNNAAKRYFATSGLDAGVAKGSQHPVLDQGILGQVLSECKARRMTNPGGAAEAIGLPSGYPPARSVLICPIASLGFVYGWICLVNKLGAEEFSEEDERLLSVHSAQAGRIYENGSLYAEVKEHAGELPVNETHFRQLAENIRDVFFLFNPSATQLLYVSPAYEAIWGRTCESLYAQPRFLADTIHIDDRPRALAAFKQMAETGQFDFEFRIVRPDGGRRWIRVRGYPILDEAGIVYRVAGIAEDLTDQFELKSVLREREAGLRHAQLMARLAYVITRPDGSFESWSETFPQFIGLDSARMPKTTRDWLNLVHPDDRAAFRDTAIAAAIAGRGRDLEYRLRHADGTWINVWQVIDPIQDQVEADGKTHWFSTLQDVTDQRSSEKELRESERRFSDMLGKIELVSLMLDRDARITYCNDYLLRLTGWQREDVLGQNWFEFFVPPGQADAKEVFAALLNDLPVAWHYESEIRTRAGGTRLVRWNNSVLRSSSGEVIGTASIGEDVTESKQQEEKIKRLNRVYAVLSGINAIIVRVRERDELFREVCRIAVEDGHFGLAWVGIVDREAEQVKPIAWRGVGSDYLDQMPPGLDETMAATYGLAEWVVTERKAIVANDMAVDARFALAAEGALRGLHSLAILPIETSHGVLAVLALYAGETGFFDQQEIKLLRELAGDIAFALENIARQERLDYLALYDPLTGLPNRHMFHQRLTQDVSDAAAGQTQLAIILLDIERFNNINNTLGRNAGDDLLKQIADRCVRAGPHPERFARLAGDQFAVSIPDIKSADAVARLLEQRIEEIFGPSFHVGDTELRFISKFGIALFPGDGRDAESLLRNAEAALKRAKATGERYLFYTQQMTDRVAGRLAMESALRRGLERNEFVLYYQPKVDVETRRIVGAEALMRWQSPRQGLVLPTRFIPLLEETGMILDVGAWALQQANRDHRRWPARNLNALRVAVNVSAVQLRHKNFVNTIREMATSGPGPTAVDIEITESVLMEDIESTVTKLRAIRDLGVNIVIDDFGTGYSSLAYLAKLPVHSLKIDRSFIISMVDDPDTMTLVSTIISLAHSLRLKVVAEGVELEDQARILRLLRCDEMQGNLISPPVPESDFAALLQPAER